MGMRQFKPKKTNIIFCAILLCSLLLTSCSKDIPFFEKDKEENGRIRSSEVFIPIQKIKNLNPLFSKDEDTYYISKLIYESLFYLDENLQAQPLLVQTYDYNEERLALTLTLKSGILWQDGEAFTGKDVKFTIDSLIALSGTGETIYNACVSNISKVELDKKDPLKVVLRLKQKNEVSAERLTFPILPAHPFKNVWEMKKKPEDFSPVGTGQYAIRKEKESSRITLVPNKYYKGKVADNILIFHILPERDVAINMLDGNDVSVVFNKNADRNTLLTGMNDINIVDFPSNEVEFIGFNNANPLFENKELRKAIAYATDVDQIIQAVYMDSGIPALTPYYPGYLGVENDMNTYAYDLKKAEALLNSVGYDDFNEDGFIEKEGEKTSLAISILVNKENSSRMAAAQILKQALDKLQISSSIEASDWDVYLQKVASGAYDIYIGGYAVEDFYDLRFLFHSGYRNPLGLKNEELDGLLDEMESGVSPVARKDAYEKVNDILIDTLPCYPLLYKTYGMISGTSLAGKSSPMFNNIYKGANNWYTLYPDN